jgi:hypothetical protein
MGALNNVKGGFNIQSLQAIDCSVFDAEHGPGKVIQGQYFCAGTVTSAGGLGTKPSTTGGSSTKPTGAASSFGMSAAAAGFGVVGGILQLL